MLEIANDAYSSRFGGSRITRQDILHLKAGNSKATLVGDLTQPGVLPEDAFDCIVITQTLQFIFDLPQAAAPALFCASTRWRSPPYCAGDQCNPARRVG